MDILLAKFPGRTPLRPSAATTDAIALRGDRGVSNDEVRDPGDVVQCDKHFLVSILDHLAIVNVEILQYDDQSGGHQQSATILGDETLPARDPESRVRDATATISAVALEVERLEKNPELFSDTRIRSEFLECAGRAAKFAQKSLRKLREQKAIITQSQARLKQLNEPTPNNPKTGRPYQPWESFCRRMPVMKDGPTMRELRQQVPDMELIGAQLLPQASVLIAERYRSKLDAMVTDIMRTTPNPDAYLSFLPSRDGPISGQAVKEGVNAAIRRPMPMIQNNAMTRRGIAFGKQEPIAEMGRLMALLENDVTTQHRYPPAAFLTYFMTREGWREVAEQRERDLEEDY